MESSASGFLRWKENVLFFLALHISPDIFVPFHCFLINRPILASDPSQNVLLATRYSLICSTIALVRTEIGSLAPALCSADARAIYIIPWVFWVQIHMQAPIGSIFLCGWVALRMNFFFMCIFKIHFFMCQFYSGFLLPKKVMAR